MSAELVAFVLSVGMALAADADSMHTGPAELTPARYYQPWTPIQSSVRPFHVAHELVLPQRAVDRIDELEKGGMVWSTGDPATTLGGTDEPFVTITETGAWTWVEEEGRCAARAVYFHEDSGLVVCDEEVAFFNDVWRVYVDAEALLDDVGRFGLLSINDFDRDLGLLPLDAEGGLDRSRPGYILHLGSFRGGDAPSEKRSAELYVARLRFDGPRTPWPQTASAPRGLTTGVPPVTPYRYNINPSGFGFGVLLRVQGAKVPSRYESDYEPDLVEFWDQDRPQPLVAKTPGALPDLLDPGARFLFDEGEMTGEVELSRTQQLLRLGLRGEGMVSSGLDLGTGLVAGIVNERWQVGAEWLHKSSDDTGDWDLRAGAGWYSGALPVYAAVRFEWHSEVGSFSSNVRTVGVTAEAIAYGDSGFVGQAGLVVHQRPRRMTLETEDDLVD